MWRARAYIREVSSQRGRSCARTPSRRPQCLAEARPTTREDAARARARRAPDLRGERDCARRRRARRWTKEELAEVLAKMPRRKQAFATDSGIPIPDLLDAGHRREADDLRDVGYPGRYPFTRGVQPTMYRGRLWTMRMFAGFGSPEHTNERFKYLLAQGRPASRPPSISRRSWATTPTPRGRGEVGMGGVAVDTLRDMEVLFDGIPLDEVTTSMTINGQRHRRARALHRARRAAGHPAREARRHRPERLPEGVHRAARVARPAPAGDALVTDMIEFCAKEVPRWNTVSHQRLSHPRGRRDGGAGARLHARRRHRLRGGVPRARPRRRRLRAAALLLLRRAQRLLRGDREVPRRAPHLGAHHEGALRREEGRVA